MDYIKLRSENSPMKKILNNFSEEDITYALYGLFLGDGRYRNGQIVINHTNKQRFYCEWIESIFIECNLEVLSKYDYICKTTFGEYEYSSVQIKVPNRYYFDSDNKCLNDNNKKIISDYVLNHINALGLLFWFLDDGYLHISFKNNKSKRFAYLNTQSFTYEENKAIQEMFKKRFDIDLKIHTDTSGFAKYKDKTYYRLYFNACNFRKFFDVVRDYLQYIPKEFYYKFDMQYTPNRIKNSVLFAEKYNLPI